jgi:hypothetical protein
MDMAAPFRTGTSRDLVLVCLHMLWPTMLVCIVPVVVLLTVGWVAIAAAWPPLLWGWLLAAIGHPMIASRLYVNRHILRGHRLLVRRLLLTGAVAANIIQTWLILTLFAAIA